MVKVNKNGFTLIETAVYVALLGMIVGTFISFVLGISGLRNKLHTMAEIGSNERVMEELVYYYIRNSGSISVPTKLATSTSIVIIARNTVATTTIFEQAGTLYLNDGITSTPITTDDVLISNLAFANLSATGSPDMIQINGNIAGISSSSVEYDYDDDFNFNISLPY
jgi:type II secretory pathway pseudopilin PulG